MNPRLRAALDGVLGAVLVTLAVVGLIALAARHPLRLDLSEGASATLAPGTEAALRAAAALPGGLSITAFGPPRRPAEEPKERLQRDFLRAVGEVAPIEVRFLDLDRDRRVAEALGVSRYGTWVLQAGGQRADLEERALIRVRPGGDPGAIEFVGEPAVAAALRRLALGEARSAVVLTGHGERRLFDRGLGELVALAEVLEAQGFRARTVDLLREASGGAPEIPAGTAVVLVVGARAPLSPAEQDALDRHLRAGGGLAVFVEGVDPAPALLAGLGIRIGPGAALDPEAFVPHLDRPLLRYGAHPITEEPARAGLATVAAAPSPLEVDGGESLLATSGRGWIERGEEHPPTPDAADRPGSADVAVAVRRGPGRVVVVGDADLVGDALMDEAPGNRAFVGRALSWLAGDAPAEPAGRPVRIRRLALDPARLDAIRWTLLAGVPLGVGLIGWGARRARSAG